MLHGGVAIHKKTERILRFASFLAPIIFLFYGLFIQQGVIDNSRYFSDSLFYAITLVWLALGAYNYFRVTDTILVRAVLLFAYHVTAVLYILFVSGFSNPFAISWALLLVASYAYFKKDGLYFSIIVLLATASFDVVFGIGTNEHIATNTLVALSTLFIGITAILMGRVHEVDSAELSRSKAQEILERDRILTIVNNLADAILSTDEDGVIRMYNAASLNLLDTNTGLNGRHIDEVLTLFNQDDEKIALSEVMQKARSVIVRDDVHFIVAEESVRLEITYSPIRSSYSDASGAGAQDGYIIILRDITKAKSLEEERDEFISVVSHELRTPITIAEGTISNVQLMMGRKDIAHNVLSKAVDTAHDQIIFLAKMVNDLSTLSRAERGVADEKESIDVKSLVDGLYSEYAPEAKKKGLRLELERGSHLGTVSASRLYLHELLQNFITNSIKYTKEGTVTLCVSRQNDMVTFEVKDTGIGISKADQAKVFKKFYRSEDYRTRETGGTGLGLYVAMKLAKKIGTTIAVVSRLNHGSSFSFTVKSADK